MRNLVDIDLGHIFSTLSKCDILFNNLCEAFNRPIVRAMDNWIMTLLEQVRCKIMRRMTCKIDLIFKWKKELGSRIFKKLESLKANNRHHLSIGVGDLKFHIRVASSNYYVLNLKACTCSCKY